MLLLRLGIMIAYCIGLIVIFIFASINWKLLNGLMEYFTILGFNYGVLLMNDDMGNFESFFDTDKNIIKDAGTCSDLKGNDIIRSEMTGTGQDDLKGTDEFRNELKCTKNEGEKGKYTEKNGLNAIENKDDIKVEVQEKKNYICPYFNGITGELMMFESDKEFYKVTATTEEYLKYQEGFTMVSEDDGLDTTGETSNMINQEKQQIRNRSIWFDDQEWQNGEIYKHEAKDMPSEDKKLLPTKEDSSKSKIETEKIPDDWEFVSRENFIRKNEIQNEQLKGLSNNSNNISTEKSHEDKK